MLRHAILVAVAFLLTIPSAKADGTSEFEAALQKVVTMASDAGYKAGWCTAMAALGEFLDQEGSRSLEKTMRPFIIAQLEESGVASKDELLDACAQAVGQNEFFKSQLASMFRKMNETRNANNE